MIQTRLLMIGWQLISEVIYIKKLISKITKFIGNIINEFFILLGLFLIVFATYIINVIASMYLMGAVLILFGLFLAFTRRE